VSGAWTTVGVIAAGCAGAMLLLITVLVLDLTYTWYRTMRVALISLRSDQGRLRTPPASENEPSGPSGSGEAR
jgi:hypothetical protein